MLLTAAAAILGDAGSPHALLAATMPTWRPAVEYAPPPPGANGNGAGPSAERARSPKAARAKSPTGTVKSDGEEAGPIAAARRKSKGSKASRARSPQGPYPASAPGTAEPHLASLTAENIAAATAPPPAPPLPPAPPAAAPPPEGAEAESPGRNALLAEINSRRIE